MSWNPISDSEFTELFQEQYLALSDEERIVFDRCRVPFWRAKIKRSDLAGEEYVFVVWQEGTWVLYFDDVEEGFNISEIDSNGTILTPGGDQYTLGEAVYRWLL